MVQIFIVDDHPLVREGLRELIELESDFAVCGEAGTAASALEQMDGTNPDLVLIDVSMPGGNGIDLVRQLRDRCPDMLLVMFSGHGERGYVNKAFDAGARGYILKGSPDELLTALRVVVAGSSYVSAQVDD